MHIRTQCPSCGAAFRVQEQFLGRPAPCRRCGKSFELLEVLDADPGTAPPAAGAHRVPEEGSAATSRALGPSGPAPLRSATPKTVSEKHAEAGSVGLRDAAAPSEKLKRSMLGASLSPAPGSAAIKSAAAVGHTAAFVGMTQYQPNGRITAIGALFMIVFGAAISAPLGAIAGLVCQFNPLLYFNLFVPVVVGAAVGGACAGGAYLGKVRNPPFTMLVIFACLLLGDGLSFVTADGVKHPYEGLWRAIANRADDGYEITHLAMLFSKGSEATSLPIKGCFMWGVFAIELGLLVWAAKLGGAFVLEGVYCEKCRCWCPVLAQKSRMLSPAALEAAIRDPSAWERLSEQEDARLFHLTVRRCERCRSACYLSVVEEIKKGGDGNERSRETLVQNAEVSRDLLRTLLTSTGFSATEPSASIALEMESRSSITGARSHCCHVTFSPTQITIAPKAGGSPIVLGRADAAGALALARPKRRPWLHTITDHFRKSDLPFPARPGVIRLRLGFPGTRRPVTLLAKSPGLAEDALEQIRDWFNEEGFQIADASVRGPETSAA